VNNQAHPSPGVLPNFLIPGAAKAGTSTLFYYLKQHPDVFMRYKEPRFFSDNWELGPEFYSRCFKGYQGQKMIGEATPRYMRHPESAARIKSLIPNVKLIFTLRDPVKRAVSHYWMRMNKRLESRSFDEVIRGGRTEFPIDYGLYYTHLRRFLDLFPREQIYINLMEEMKVDFKSSLVGIFNFLNLEACDIKDEGAKNVATMFRNRSLDSLIRKVRAAKRLKRMIPSSIRSRGARIWKLNVMESFKAPDLTNDQRRYLEEIFLPEIEGLEKMMGMDLSLWKKNYISLKR